MNSEKFLEITQLPVLIKEDDKRYSVQKEYHDPVTAAQQIPSDASFDNDGIIWSDYRDKTCHRYRLYRTGDSTWIIAYDYEFLD